MACAAAIRDMAQSTMLLAITAPTLVLTGRQDPATTVAHATVLHRVISGSRLVILDDAAHLSNIEQPQAFNAALRAAATASTMTLVDAPAPLDPTQVKERYLQIADLARRLVADFRQVEDNFRMLDLQTRERITTSTQPKGELLDSIFGETDHIHRSDQGKSFEAFWEFLMSPQRQDELREWLRAVHALQPIQELPREDFVRSIPSLLLDAGEKVQGTVAQLVEQLRRFVDDQAHLENRRIVDLIREIEQHAVRLKGAVRSQPC